MMLRQAISHPVPSPVASKAQRDASKQHLPRSLPVRPAEAMPIYEPSVAPPAPGLQPSSARHPGSGYCPDVTTTLSAHRDHPRQHTPYSHNNFSVGVSAHTSAEYTNPHSQASFATIFPNGYVPNGPHGVWQPVGTDTHVMFAGAGYANNDVYARVVDGRIVQPPPVPHFDAPADNWKVHAPLVNRYEAPTGGAYSPVFDVTGERFAGTFPNVYPLQASPVLMSGQGRNPEDEPFDLAALEYSIANSPTSSTSSSLSGAFVNSYDAPEWAVHADIIGAQPAQYSRAGFVDGWSASQPEGTIWHTDSGGYRTAAVEPTLDVNAWFDATIVDGNVTTFAGTPSVNPHPILMSANYFNDSQALWRSKSFSGFPIRQSNDYTSSATSSAHYEQHQAVHQHTFINPYPL